MTVAPDPADLVARWRGLAVGARAPRPRDAAAALGVSEGALTEARRAAGEAVPLRLPPRPEGFAALIGRLGALGPLMALTRNDACVSEITGVYPAVKMVGSMAQTVGAVDLRMFLDQWAVAYAVSDGERRSIQIYDVSGVAVHKIHPREGTDLAGWAALVDGLADRDAPETVFARLPAPPADAPDDRIDIAALRADWAALEHSHAFFGLLARHGVGRGQAMRLGGPAFARRAPEGAAKRVLDSAAATGVWLMIFVGNRGCVQIYSGPVARIEPMGPWLNVLDPAFNLHLRTDRVAEAWIVRKPSAHGDVHSLELFDASGGAIAQIFGLREPGTTERADWRALLAGLDGGLPC